MTVLYQGSGGKGQTIGNHNNHGVPQNTNDFGFMQQQGHPEPNSPGMVPVEGWQGRGGEAAAGKVPEMAPERAGSGRRRQRGNERRRGRGGQAEGKGKGKGKEGGSCGSSSTASPLASPRAINMEGLLFPIEPGGDTS